MKRINVYCFVSLALLCVCASCTHRSGNTEASGTFEATEVIVSAQANGALLRFSVEEGKEVLPNQCLGVIDTVPLALKKKQLQSSILAVQSKKPDVAAQLAVLEQQRTTAERERSRLENLVKSNAATQKQLDDAQAQCAVLDKQLRATRLSLEEGSQSLDLESASLRAQQEQVDDQLRKSYVYSPIRGTVLVTYAEAGELATTGKPLFKVADLRRMILRAYVTADQLALLHTGQRVAVNAELGSEANKAYNGVVTWIASTSEFTPKTIQTRDERANLVYAVKVAVPNDGALKIGMYGSIRFE